MAILIEAFSVVVRNETLCNKHDGGRAAFVSGWTPRMVCADEFLTRIAFMQPREMDRLVKDLESQGFQAGGGVSEPDFAIVSAMAEVEPSCYWLTIGEYKNGLIVAWLRGTDPGRIVVPDGWKWESDLRYISAEDANKKLQFIKMEGDLEVYRDKETGESYYCPRPGQKC